MRRTKSACILISAAALAVALGSAATLAHDPAATRTAGVTVYATALPQGTFEQ